MIAGRAESYWTVALFAAVRLATSERDTTGAL
jgi:hypothetical protein